MKNYIKILFLFFCLTLISNLSHRTVQAATTLHLEVVTTNLNSPVFLTSPSNDNRLFIVEEPGRIRIHADGSTLAIPFLDITPQVIYDGERGLLGLTFHPDYANNGFFYLNYTTLINSQTYSRISRFTVDSLNPNIADTSSEEILLPLLQPFNNHNGGMLAFGADGYLYAGFGDGGSGGDPNNNGQNGENLFGTIIRLDINGILPYAIPPDNPFVNNNSFLDEIWAYGLRNPWRFSFDRLNSDLYIGDVGQNLLEEIDVQLSSSTGGENYGWRLKEGSNCFNPLTNCEDGVTVIDPIYEYTHSGGHCSVTGGYVYRGSCLPEFQGMYFFADFCTSKIWSFKSINGILSEFTDYTPTLSPSLIASFGEDSNGEIYIISLNGTVYRIVPEGGATVCNSSECCQGIRGNVDNDILDAVDISDLIYIVDFIFTNGPDPACTEEANADSDALEAIDISDLIYIVDFIFTGGPAPIDCP